MDLYVILKFVHVLLAILAVGFNASYSIWLARAGRNPQHLDHVLRGIKILDDRAANPAYVLLLLTGVAMVLVGDIPFSAFWIAASLVLYALAVVAGLGLYTPTLRRQIAVLQAEGPQSAAYTRLSVRGTALGIFLAVDVVLIVFLMVTKPGS